MAVDGDVEEDEVLLLDVEGFSGLTVVVAVLPDAVVSDSGSSDWEISSSL